VVRSGLFSRDNEHEPLQYGKEITTALCISSNLKETEVKTIDENKCQQCGAHALPDAKYCEQCGAQLHVEVESQPQSVPSYVLLRRIKHRLMLPKRRMRASLFVLSRPLLTP